MIDESGRYLGEEYTLALCVDHVLRRRKGPVVTNCSTSRDERKTWPTKYGVPFYRSAVGEANVVDKMLEADAVMGGEGNGGVIDPRSRAGARQLRGDGAAFGGDGRRATSRSASSPMNCRDTRS